MVIDGRLWVGSSSSLPSRAVVERCRQNHPKADIQVKTQCLFECRDPPASNRLQHGVRVSTSTRL